VRRRIRWATLLQTPDPRYLGSPGFIPPLLHRSPVSATEAPPHSPPSAATRRHLRLWLAPRFPATGWRSALREFVLIVLGVLAALAGNSWWEGRQERGREEVYLRQLAADLRESERIMEQGLLRTRGYYLGAARVLRAFHSAEPPPPDSLATWIRQSDGYMDPRPVLGTVRGLIASGDLRLLRDDALRSAVLAFAQEADGYETAQRDFTAEFLRYIGQAAEQVNLLEARYAGADSAQLDLRSRADVGFPLPVGERRQPFPNDYHALLRNRALFGLYDNIHITQQNLVRNQEGMLERIRDLRSEVEARLPAPPRPSSYRART
jgi:hypothetical protein